MKKNRWNKNDIAKLPEWARTQIEAQLAQHQNPVQKQNELTPLGPKTQNTTGLVNIAGTLTVRITRVSRKPLDDDNLSGGCKELRDAIAAFLGRKDDSHKSGLHWQYAQKTGQDATEIEIFQTGGSDDRTTGIVPTASRETI